MIAIWTAGIIHSPRGDSEPVCREDLVNLPEVFPSISCSQFKSWLFENELSAAIACYFATLCVHPHRQVSQPRIGKASASRVIQMKTSGGLENKSPSASVIQL
jgi:hypothetical protein